MRARSARQPSLTARNLLNSGGLRGSGSVLAPCLAKGIRNMANENEQSNPTYEGQQKPGGGGQPGQQKPGGGGQPGQQKPGGGQPSGPGQKTGGGQPGGPG